MAEMNEDQKRRFDAFRRYVIPLAGVAEAIVTQGKSPGTAAMNVESIYQGQEDRAKQYQRQAEQDAMQRKLFGIQEKKAGREEATYDIENKRREDYENQIKNDPDLSPLEKILMISAGPEKGIQYINYKTRGSNRPLSAWEQRALDWEEVMRLPAGQEKNDALNSFYHKWTPSTGYNASPAAIKQAVDKSVAIGEATLPIKKKTAGETAEARVTGESEGIKRIPDKTRESLTEDYNNIQNLKRVSEKFDPKFVGPVKGRSGNMSEWLGTIGVDEKVFRAEVQNYVDRLIKSTTGAQMSEAEAKRIMRETVNFNLTPKAYFATLNSNIETIKMRMTGAIKVLKTLNYDTGELETLLSGGVGMQPGKTGGAQSEQQQAPQGVGSKFTIEKVE